MDRIDEDVHGRLLLRQIDIRNRLTENHFRSLLTFIFSRSSIDCRRVFLKEGLLRNPSVFALSLTCSLAWFFGSVESSGAVSACGTQNINGTAVQECYSSGDDYVTFSNSCGTQRLTQRELQNGAIPNQIIPCPRPGGSPSGNDDFAARQQRQRDEEARQARERENAERREREQQRAEAFQDADNGQTAFAKGDFKTADELFMSASNKFARAGDSVNEKISRKNERHSYCLQMITEAESVSTLRSYRGEQIGGATPPEVDVCREFPQAMAAIDRKIAAMERQKAAEEEAARERVEAARERAAAAQWQRERENAVASGASQAGRAQDRFANNNPLSGEAPAFGGAAARATQPQATGPIFDANSLRAQQGTCSDITGTGGGGGPTNCTQSNSIPPKLQAQIAQANSSSKSANPSRGDLQSAAGQYRQVEAALRAAGEFAEAAQAAEEALRLEDLLASSPSRSGDVCPAPSPQVFWKDHDYCANANCFERSTAYYGFMCQRDGTHDDNNRAAKRVQCLEKLDALKTRNLSDSEIELLMGDAGCKPNGAVMEVRDIERWKNKHKGLETSARDTAGK